MPCAVVLAALTAGLVGGHVGVIILSRSVLFMGAKTQHHEEALQDVDGRPLKQLRLPLTAERRAQCISQSAARVRGTKYFMEVVDPPMNIGCFAYCSNSSLPF
jgi:hypothetical protein